jgi:hypothetical protein
LHPSWEAKKSQQAIVPATGKKIVFEDDVKEELHPSWVAKKQAKEQAAAKLASVKPTKITFNDE